MAYDKDYIGKLFPAGIPDARFTTWFENANSDNNTFQFKKFINVYSTGSGSSLNVNNDDSAIIFRLPDALLLAAEAAAELSDDATARDYVNQVRLAAAAPALISSGGELKDDIYRERCRELIGEGQFFFDLVRTKRAINTEFSKAVISVSNFNAGAWTWPLIISATERTANPNLVGNNFWN
jgi:starch-binding outer membrane protein, SusD/RagB family